MEVSLISWLESRSISAILPILKKNIADMQISMTTTTDMIAMNIFVLRDLFFNFNILSSHAGALFCDRSPRIFSDRAARKSGSTCSACVYEAFSRRRKR